MSALPKFCLGLVACGMAFSLHTALPEMDQRGRDVRTLNTLRDFPAIPSKSAWRSRAEAIREQALVSCGLWPLPEKTPLNARIFGRIERDGYSVEKVYFQSYPGFYVAGNLYRPLGRGAGPFPGVLNPHGHWATGRLEDGVMGSTAARCIAFARQGMVAFSWDMVGYNDTHFAQPAGEPGYKRHRHFANDPTNQLWNISQMGLQLWNSIRALDFLCTLPDVDQRRLACTGESGGGTQTFMLGAVDTRLAVQAPVVMVSHSMQGGCSCENVSGLRVDYSNMEIAAAAAPRPQLFVSATGDWTKTTLTLEGPAVGGIYRQLGAEDHLRYVRFDYNHNYNLTSREAVYGWFGRWLLPKVDPALLKERPYTKEPDSDLRVFPDGKLPADAVTEEELAAWLIKQAQEGLVRSKPLSTSAWKQYQARMLPAWKRNLLVDLAVDGLLVEPGQPRKLARCTSTPVAFGRAGRGDRIPGVLITPDGRRGRNVAVLVHPEGKTAFVDSAGAPAGLAARLIEKQIGVLLLDTFQTGEAATVGMKPRNYFTNFFTGYNRTDVQERVQDIVTACAVAKEYGKARRVIVCGSGRAGLWTLLAAPAASAVVADCAALDSTDDQALLAPDLFSPGLRKMGGFEGVAAMAAGHPLLLHNTGERFSTGFLREIYAANKAVYREERAALDNDAIALAIAGW